MDKPTRLRKRKTPARPIGLAPGNALPHRGLAALEVHRPHTRAARLDVHGRLLSRSGRRLLGLLVGLLLKCRLNGRGHIQQRPAVRVPRPALVRHTHKSGGWRQSFTRPNATGAALNVWAPRRRDTVPSPLDDGRRSATCHPRNGGRASKFGDDVHRVRIIGAPMAKTQGLPKSVRVRLAP